LLAQKKNRKRESERKEVRQRCTHRRINYP
jgi:hypothetical protein